MFTELAPNDDRLTAVGPVERFIVGSPEPYKPGVGTGRKVGVAGREVGVGIELVVDTVLVLSRPSPDNRDCGRRIPDFPRFRSVNWVLADLVIVEREKGDEEGLDSRRRSFSLVGVTFIESSMISTQPEVSALGSFAGFKGVFFFSASRSALFLFNVFFQEFSEVVAAVLMEFTTAFAVDSAFFPEILPMRILGTRVCSFCSRLRTRARISDTICTPLLLAAMPFAELVLIVRVLPVKRGVAFERGEVIGRREGE